MKKCDAIENYISSFPPNTQNILNDIRKTILNLSPNLQETMSYGIPTFDLNGKHLVHFAGYKKHIGFYPGPEAIEIFRDELNNYKTSKGTIQFPIDKPIPIELVQKITKYRITQILK
jgi:uncharacterized protein YdhG (YjbR/CyaY superfamily)